MANKSSKQPSLDPNVAADLLQDIFEKCDAEPTQIPVEVLVSYTNYRRERYSFQKIVIVIMLILFCMLPVISIGPKFDITPDTSTTFGRPHYSVDINNKMPISSVTATLDGQRIPVYQLDNHTYSVEPAINGKLDITVTLLNNQYDTKEITVEEVDLSAPKIVSSEQKGDELIMYLSDEGTGVDYEQIYALDSIGNTLLPSSYNEEEGYVVFSFPTESMNLYITDYAKNTLQLVITVK